jgi:Pentapeptide repeats (8 copies)
MSNVKLVKFEEVTPTLLPVAYFDGHLAELVNHLKLPIYGGYDGLDDMVFAFLTLPSGKTVTLGEYANSPRKGVDLYVDSKMAGISSVVYESCKQIGKPRNQVIWLRDNFQAEIEQLFEENGDISEIEKEVENQQVVYNPIACFQHSLGIYNQKHFPEYWAMLQYNLGSAYYKAFQDFDGDRGWNLSYAIYCYYQSRKIHSKDKYPERWEIFRETIKKVKTLCSIDLRRANLQEVNLSLANLNGTDLSESNLRYANLRGADLSETNLNGADFSNSNLTGANLSNSNVAKARFDYATGISSELREDLKQRGAIFDDRPPVESRSVLSYPY